MYIVPWEAEVTAARRTHPIQKKRSPGERFCARFWSYDPPLSKWLVEAVSRWSGVRSQWILRHGPVRMTARQLGFQFAMMERWEPSNLVSEVPEEECHPLTAYGGGRRDPSSRSLTAEEKWRLIRDLCQKHRGEVREITRQDGRPGAGAMQRRAVGAGEGSLEGHWQPWAQWPDTATQRADRPF